MLRFWRLQWKYADFWIQFQSSMHAHTCKNCKKLFFFFLPLPNLVLEKVRKSLHRPKPGLQLAGAHKLVTSPLISANALQSWPATPCYFRTGPPLSRNCQLCWFGPNDLGSCMIWTNKSAIGIQNPNKADTSSSSDGDLSGIWTHVWERLKAGSLIHGATWPL